MPARRPCFHSFPVSVVMDMGIMEKNMETTAMGYIGIYWGYIGVMENKMETTI